MAWTTVSSGGPRTPARRRAPDGVVTRVARNPDELAELAPVWDGLAARPGTGVTQDRAWSEAYAATFGPPGGLEVLAVTSPVHGMAMAPLERRDGVLGRLELPGVKELYEPMDLLYEDAAALPALAEALLRIGRPIFLRRVPADSPVVAALRQASEGRGVFVARPVVAAPFIALDAGWLEPDKKLVGRYRSDLRRARRHATALGTVRCEVLAPTPEEVDRLLDEVYEVEAASWKGAADSALSIDRARGLFYRRYGRAAARKGILRVAFLRIDERAAATQLAAEWDHGYWLLKIGYRDEFARCSPGSLLVAETLRYAAERGLSHYEFLGGVEPWTRTWTDAERACVSVRVYPYGWAGMAALALDAGERAAHDVGERMGVRS